MSSTVEIQRLEGKEQGFAADQQVWSLGAFALTHALMPGEGHARAWRHLGKDPIDHWCLVVVRDAGRDGSRLIGLRSLGRPFEGAAADRDVLSLFAPRSLFRGLSSLLDAAPDVIADVGLGAILADYLLSLQRRLPGVTEADAPQIVEATRAMIAACLTPAADLRAAAEGAIAATVLERADAIISANLAAKDLGPEFLCRALGVSRSRLYRLFEPTGGVSRAIQRARLIRAQDALRDPADGRPIVVIADALGFADPSSFSRSFRREFGHSPSDARSAGALGFLAPLAAAKPLVCAPIDRLGDVLRSLHA
ncbi:helix-turn-helix domain-containing protein [Methylocella silvestris]|nr:helix-turn-helix domain-containing protein [Methylocella silvestris]